MHVSISISAWNTCFMSKRPGLVLDIVCVVKKKKKEKIRNNL